MKKGLFIHNFYYIYRVVVCLLWENRVPYTKNLTLPGGSMIYRIVTIFSILLLLSGIAMAQRTYFEYVMTYPLSENDNAKGVTINGNTLYIIGDNSGLKIFDLGADPASPTYLGGIVIPGSFARSVFVKEGFAYVAAGDSGLQIVDVSNPGAPAIVGRWEQPSNDIAHTALTVTISGDYAYLADGYAGLEIINVTDVNNPTFVGNYTSTGYIMGVAVDGNNAFIGDNFLGDLEYGQLTVLDVTDPTVPTFAGGANINNAGAYDVIVANGFAYVAAFTYGLKIFDISYPTSPAIAGAYDSPGRVERLFFADSLTFIADRFAGIEMLDSRNPYFPALLDTVHTPGGDAFDVAFNGEYVYVADGTAIEVYRVVTYVCTYVAGDVNNSGTWTGQDVTYAVRFFKGGNAPFVSCECPPGSGNTWFVAGDVNGSCTFTGQDVTYMVRHFKSGVPSISCPSCPPGQR
jgi:hypothetical protein